MQKIISVFYNRDNCRVQVNVDDLQPNDPPFLKLEIGIKHIVMNNKCEMST